MPKIPPVWTNTISVTSRMCRGNFLAQAVKGFTGIDGIQNDPFQRRKGCYALVDVICSPSVARTDITVKGSEAAP